MEGAVLGARKGLAIKCTWPSSREEEKQERHTEPPAWRRRKGNIKNKVYIQEGKGKEGLAAGERGSTSVKIAMEKGRKKKNVRNVHLCCPSP